MSKQSAGILAYKFNKDEVLEVLLVHPGGPFFINKDEGVWSIPKGEYHAEEDPLTVAKREFREETGNELPECSLHALQPIKIKSGKVITAWAVEADFEKPFIESNLFEMEWPPRSGNMQSFPEVDDARWFTVEEALMKINAGQKNLLVQLQQILK